MQRLLTLMGLCLAVYFLFGSDIATANAGTERENKPWTGKLASGVVITEKDLKDLQDEHREWLMSGRKVGNCLDLRKATLSGADLSGADLSGADLSGARLSVADLSGADLSGARLSVADLSGADLSGARLSVANLFKANLLKANLSVANLTLANLFGANLIVANLFGANLSGANLFGANLSGANLSGADLSGADLSKAHLSGTNIANAELSNTTWDHAVYEYVVGVPAKEYLGGMRGVDTLVYETTDGYSGLVALRNALKEAGLRETERQATYAIEAGKLRHMPWANPERIVRTVLFLWPCGFGLYPGRPLEIFLVLIPLFSVFYYAAIRRPHGEDAIYRIWQDGRLPKYIGTKEPERLYATGFAAVGWALYFSLLSACRIGWRELNPGSWIVNMQRREYLLKATDWVRMVSGIQALTSVYLIALAVLTYFGRPFE